MKKSFFITFLSIALISLSSCRIVDILIQGCELVSLDIQPNIRSAIAGSTILYTAEAKCQDGRVLDWTDQVFWSSSNTSVARFDNAIPNQASIVSEGSFTVTAQVVNTGETQTTAPIESTMSCTL